MWNISKIDHRTAKGTKIWENLIQCKYAGTFGARFLEFGLGSFGALCKISNFTIFKTLLLSQFSSDSSKLIQGITIIQADTFLRSTKNWKNYGILNFFLTRDQIFCWNFQVLFLPQFSLESIQTL